jgi:hypothetical protein
VLADSPFKEGIVLFNGSNTDERSRAIYAAWLEKHAGTDRVSPVQRLPTCVPRSWIISARKAAS